MTKKEIVKLDRDFRNPNTLPDLAEYMEEKKMLEAIEREVRQEL